MRGRHPMHLFMIAVVCSSAMSCRRDTRADDEAAIRAATREWNAAEAAKDLEKCISSNEAVSPGSSLAPEVQKVSR